MTLLTLPLLLLPPSPCFVLCHVSVSPARHPAGHLQLCICKCMFCPSAVPKAGAWLLTTSPVSRASAHNEYRCALVEGCCSPTPQTLNLAAS